MWISHEAIYQALCIQARGALKRDWWPACAPGEPCACREHASKGRGKTFVTPEILISERPAEVDDRAVPGHCECDLIVGLNKLAIGPLVERTTRFTMLLHPPPMEGHGTQPRAKNGPPALRRLLEHGCTPLSE